LPNFPETGVRCRQQIRELDLVPETPSGFPTTGITPRFIGVLTAALSLTVRNFPISCLECREVLPLPRRAINRATSLRDFHVPVLKLACRQNGMVTFAPRNATQGSADKRVFMYGGSPTEPRSRRFFQTIQTGYNLSMNGGVSKLTRGATDTTPASTCDVFSGSDSALLTRKAYEMHSVRGLPSFCSYIKWGGKRPKTRVIERPATNKMQRLTERRVLE
jgi:hypothetical protein